MTALQQEIINNPHQVLTALSSVFPHIFDFDGDEAEVEEAPHLVDFEKQAEIVNGKVEIKEMPGLRSSGIAMRIAIKIGIYLETDKIGRLYGADASFTTIDENERMPDVSFLSNEKLVDGEPISKADFAPDLAVEVISPSDQQGAIAIKIKEYLAAGVKQIWRVEPQVNAITVYKSLEDAKIYTMKDVLTCDEILPGFKLVLSDIFID